MGGVSRGLGGRAGVRSAAALPLGLGGLGPAVGAPLPREGGPERSRVLLRPLRCSCSVTPASGGAGGGAPVAAHP